MKKTFIILAALCCCFSVKAKANGPLPTDEIWYTSTDEQVVNPNNTHAFGATFIRSTYQNGKGVIKFDGPVTSIGADAFWECSSLNGITIPNSVTSIGNNAFANCPNLTDIAIPNAVESIGNYAFAYTGLTNITIPSSVTSIAMTAFAACQSLTTMIVEHGNTVYDSRNNCNAIIKTGTNTLISGCKNSVIPSGVTSIGNYAFRSCTLASITIPNSVTTIGMRAFYGCTALEYIIFMPDTPPSFLPDCFEDCSKLSSIYVPEEAVNTYKYKDELSSYVDIIKAINIEEIKAAAIAEIQNAFDGETGSAYLNGLIADEMAAINNATTIEIITENKVAALAKLSVVVPVYKEGKAEAFGNLPTEGTSGSYVKVILGEKNVKLYNPEKVEFGKE